MTPTLLCLIVAITSGDTLTARCGDPGAHELVQVRLTAIDAPNKKQPFGHRSSQALAELTLQKQARLECIKTDHGQRRLCTVWVAPASAPDGPKTLDPGLAMLTIGMARWHRSHPSGQTPQARGQYEFAEQEARARRAGLWAERAPAAQARGGRKATRADPSSDGASSMPFGE